MSDPTPGQDPQPTGQNAGGGQGPDTFDRAYVEDLRKENARYRTERNELRTKLDGYADYDDLKAKAARWLEAEEGKKSELEKLQERLSTTSAERDRLQQEANDIRLQSAFMLEAYKAGYSNPEDAYRLADLSKISIDDKGSVKGVEDAVKALEGRLPMAKPKAPSVDGGAGGADPGRRAPVMTEADVREMAAQMGVQAKFLAEHFGVKLTD